IVHALLYHSIQSTRIVRMCDRSFGLISSPRINYSFASAVARWLDRILRRFDNLAVAESEAGRAHLISLGYDPRRVAVAPNGVDTDRYRPDEVAAQRLRAEWGVLPEEIVIGAVGRLHSQK